MDENVLETCQLCIYASMRYNVNQKS